MSHVYKREDIWRHEQTIAMIIELNHGIPGFDNDEIKDILYLNYININFINFILLQRCFTTTTLLNRPIVSLLIWFICILIHDYTLCFTDSPCYNVSYYNYIFQWSYYIVIHFIWQLPFDYVIIVLMLRM